MTDTQDLRDMLSSLKSHLEYLQETGVDELPLEALQLSVNSSGHETLKMVREKLGECLRCQLGNTRTHLVFGAGNPQARIVFVGEAPGRDEDIQGEPLVGEAGQLLMNIIQAMKLHRNDVYICNILKCRPPENRNPQHDEIEQCHPFLTRQLNAIQPKVIVALGTLAAHSLLETKEPMSKLRGQFHNYHGIPLMATFHPAFLLSNLAMKKQVWQDMQQVMHLLKIEVS